MACTWFDWLRTQYLSRPGNSCRACDIRQVAAAIPEPGRAAEVFRGSLRDPLLTARMQLWRRSRLRHSSFAGDLRCCYYHFISFLMFFTASLILSFFSPSFLYNIFIVLLPSFTSMSFFLFSSSFLSCLHLLLIIPFLFIYVPYLCFFRLL
jgi:hypothetical protein